MIFKDTIPKPNQIKMIISFVFVALIVTLIIVFKKDLYKVNENITDAERFHKEFTTVSVDNVYKYVSIDEAYELFKSEKAAVFFGFKDCAWCDRYAATLNEVAKENNIDTVYYCNIYNDRKDNTQGYVKLIEMLNKYLSIDNLGNKRMYVPDLYIVKNGKIVGHNNDTSQIEGTDIDEYYKINEKNLKEKLNKLFSNIKNSTCSDNEKTC